MSGKKGRSGRLPRAVELARSRGKDDALSCVRRRLPQILEVIVQKAEAGDKECAIYCVDRLLGRPRIEVDQRLKTSVELDAGEYIQALKEARASVTMLPPETEALPAERQLPSPTRDVSHDYVSEVDITAPFEHDVAESSLCGHHDDIERND